MEGGFDEEKRKAWLPACAEAARLSGEKDGTAADVIDIRSWEDGEWSPVPNRYEKDTVRSKKYIDEERE